MTLQECKSIVNVCFALTGKQYKDRFIFSLFTAPLIRDRTNEMITNLLSDNSHLNERIISQYEHFEVLVLLCSNDKTINPLVTPIEEVLNNIFNNLNHPHLR